MFIFVSQLKTNKTMDREILRRHFSALLMETDNENHLKCDIIIGENEAMGLSTL